MSGYGQTSSCFRHFYAWRLYDILTGNCIKDRGRLRDIPAINRIESLFLEEIADLWTVTAIAHNNPYQVGVYMLARVMLVAVQHDLQVPLQLL